MKTFKANGDAIRKLRESKDLRQKDFAEMEPKISERTLRSAESGARMRLWVLYHIATKLDVHVSTIMLLGTVKRPAFDLISGSSRQNPAFQFVGIARVRALPLAIER
jgi:transcriptional regulator with XRE-family HTH domain